MEVEGQESKGRCAGVADARTAVPCWWYNIQRCVLHVLQTSTTFSTRSAGPSKHTCQMLHSSLRIAMAHAVFWNLMAGLGLGRPYHSVSVWESWLSGVRWCTTLPCHMLHGRAVHTSIANWVYICTFFASFSLVYRKKIGTGRLGGSTRHSINLMSSVNLHCKV